MRSHRTTSAELGTVPNNMKDSWALSLKEGTASKRRRLTTEGRSTARALVEGGGEDMIGRI